jgi:serine/threonine protein kinase
MFAGMRSERWGQNSTAPWDERGAEGIGNLIVPGTVISERYIVTRLLGEGGMGCVYEAEHIHIGKKVAVKVLNPEFGKNTEAIGRFRQEAQIAGTIGHLNICEVMDFGATDEGLPFLVMEYLDGESLAEVLHRQRSLPVGVACGIISQVLDALVEVHGRGIVHRDLKPENIFITQVKGHGIVVKILDFGISRVLQDESGMIRLTRTGTMMGTPYYMSPEQAKGKKDVLFTSDLYSCGVILYEMVTGQVPFGGANYNEVLFNIISGSMPDPAKLAPDLPPALAAILKRSMTRNPADRYGSAEAFKDDVDRVLLELSTPPAAETPPLRPASASMDTSLVGPIVRPKMKMAIVGAITALFMLVLAGIILLAWFYRGKADERGTESSGADIETGTKVMAPPKEHTGESAAPKKDNPKTVKISLTNTPVNVKIHYDGKVIDGSVLETAPGAAPITFIVAAEGYEDRLIEVVPSADATLDVSLTPVTGQRQETKPAKKKSKAKKEETNNKKMKHVWNY